MSVTKGKDKEGGGGLNKGKVSKKNMCVGAAPLGQHPTSKSWDGKMRKRSTKTSEHVSVLVRRLSGKKDKAGETWGRGEQRMKGGEDDTDPEATKGGRE